MDDLNNMTRDTFKVWAVNALSVFLSLRHTPVQGNFEELTASQRTKLLTMALKTINTVYALGKSIFLHTITTDRVLKQKPVTDTIINLPNVVRHTHCLWTDDRKIQLF